MFFALLFLEDECRGILFLSPEDEALIRSLPDFETFSIGIGKNGIRSYAFAEDSVAAKLSKKILLWDAASQSSMQIQFMDRVALFLSKPNNRKHTLKEFSAMIPHPHAVELQYCTRFTQIFHSDQCKKDPISRIWRHGDYAGKHQHKCRNETGSPQRFSV
jgi:hypothetical protein